MAGLLSLKWNNHSQAFLNLLNNLYAKEQYCDATIACQGKFYPIHRIVLSTCSEYFEEIFKITQCKHPFVIVNDIQPTELEALLNYMYKGDVNVLQDNLPGLIKAAEALKVKGLAVPDDDLPPAEKRPGGSKKRVSTALNSSPHAKRKKPLVCLDESTTNAEVSPLRTDYMTESSKKNNQNLEHSFMPEEVKEVSASLEEPSDGGYSNIESKYPIPEETATIKMEPYDPSFPESLGDREEPVKDIFAEVPHASDWPDDPNQKKETMNPYVMLRMGRGTALSRISGFEASAAAIDAGDFALGEDASGLLLGAALFPPTSPVPRKCPHCSYTSKKATNLKRHIFAKHTGERPFGCRLCPYRCVTKEALKVHLRKHTGEKPFPCAFCPFKASSKRSVESHELTRHGRCRQEVGAKTALGGL